MEERIRPTRSGLFSIELMVAVGVFTLCAAICVGLFVRSELISANSADLNRAVAEARSLSECFKAAGGDLEKTAELAGGDLREDGALYIDYDGDWNRLDSRSGATFELQLRLQDMDEVTTQPLPKDGTVTAGVRVDNFTTKNEYLLEWVVKAWGEAVS